MMNRPEHITTSFWQSLMDCRVKPGDDREESPRHVDRLSMNAKPNMLLLDSLNSASDPPCAC
jgi:hypothetical protein